jgi:bacterioferritin (cytochrome b1)
MTSTADLLTELNGLLRLTAVEADIARSRSLQARDDDVRHELLQNARHADLRRVALQDRITELGGVPDLLGVALDRVATAARTQVLDQAMPITEALMADLVLEHQLRDRAAFARVLADTQGRREIVSTLEKVEAAHVAAIEWIERRLGEVALGGPSALRPTPLQTTAAVGRRVATLPSRAVVAGINRGLAVADRVGDRVGERLGRTREVAGAAEDALVAGRDAFLREAESQSEARGQGAAVTALHRTRADAGALTARELPIDRYENLTAARAIQRIQRLDDAADVRAVREFEAAHKNRSSVLRAADERVSELAGDAMS